MSAAKRSALRGHLTPEEGTRGTCPHKGRRDRGQPRPGRGAGTGIGNELDRAGRCSPAEKERDTRGMLEERTGARERQGRVAREGSRRGALQHHPLGGQQEY